MALPLSEITAAARIAYTIYKLGFSQYTSSQQEYLDFGKDISLLKDTLEAVVTSVEYIQNQAPNTGGRSEQFASFRTIVGDFSETLKRCEGLIKRNSKFARDSNGFVHNIQWNTGLGKHVQYLRDRVSFHAAKINLILTPLKMKLYTDIRRDMSIMHQDMIFHLDDIIRRLSPQEERNFAFSTTELLEVPDYLRGKFETSAWSLRPSSPFPVNDIIDALALHLGESTQKFRSEPPILILPDTCEYINLMKCVWLLKRLQSNPEVQLRYQQDVLWGAYFRQLLLRVRFECRRFSPIDQNCLRAPERQQILQEPEEKFEIWVKIEEMDDFDDITEPMGFEREILRISLSPVGGRTHSIVVFRISGSRLRLVHTTTRLHVVTHEALKIDGEKVVLHPFYAWPDASADALSFGWKEAPADQDSHAFTFESLGDIHDLQGAITNFGVLEDCTGVKAVQAKESLIGSLKSVGTDGRAQVWKYRSPTEDESAAAAPVNRGGGPRRQSSALTDSSGTSSSVPGSWARNYAQSINPSTSIQQFGDKAQITPPVPAQLVLLVKRPADTGCFISILIKAETRLSPESCHCNDESKQCKKIMIKSNDKEGVVVRTFQTQRSPEEQWNLGILGHPEHVDFKNTMRQTSARFVVVEFDNVESRKRIMTAFEEARDLFRIQLAGYHKDLERIAKYHVVRG